MSYSSETPKAYPYRIPVGILCTILSWVPLVLYVAIIKIFLTNKKFKGQISYLIMANLGIFDCLIMLDYAALGVFIFAESTFYPFIETKFLSRGLKSPKLRYLEIIKCDTYKSLCDDLLENVKSGATRYIILEQSSQKFDIAFFQEVIDWWQREGAGKERFLKFALRRSDGKKLLETLGDTLTSHSMRHNTCEKSFVFVTMENCQNVRLEMKVSNKTM
ncbi:hypothetical protein QR680_010265 [Steinernema hermaphroditum]|uniref:Uncharacterized protein n=1 Tax=Steinernema hermaphroditum TaxID=289476 RepID=A0AA39INC8_9BILA|nr:hypothetical protein QR680_010265 [Steinernema hermaphroditum]